VKPVPRSLRFVGSSKSWQVLNRVSQLALSGSPHKDLQRQLELLAQSARAASRKDLPCINRPCPLADPGAVASDWCMASRDGAVKLAVDGEDCLGKAQKAAVQGIVEEDTFPEQGLLTEFELCMIHQSHGLYDPMSMRCRRRVPQEKVQFVSDSVDGRVTVAVPTTESRQSFHEQVWRVFEAQTWPDKELIVVETFSNAPSPFFTTRSQEDDRIIYVPLEVTANMDLTIGLKRNMCTHLASGKFIANFDDDDLYAPEYLSTMLQSMEQQMLDAITLSGWYVVDVHTGNVGYMDPTAVCNREDVSTIDGWVFGYGFSYVYTRGAALSFPYLDLNMNEDWNFYWALRKDNLRKRGGRGVQLQLMDPSGVALLSDGWGLCVHTLHRSSTSDCWAHREVPLHEVRALKVQALGDVFASQLRRSPELATGSRFILGPPCDRWRSLGIDSRYGHLEITVVAGARVGDIRHEVLKAFVTNYCFSPGLQVLLFRGSPVEGQQESTGPPMQDDEIIPLRCGTLWAVDGPAVVRVVDMLDLKLTVSVEIPNGRRTHKMVREALLREFASQGVADTVAVAKVRLAKMTKARGFIALTPDSRLGGVGVLFAACLAEALGKEREEVSEVERKHRLSELYTEIYGQK